MQATSGPSLLDAALSDPAPRSRLIAALGLVLCEKSFSSISVADVVRIARVSKRTFYEHFATREACYIATYEMLTESLLARIALAAEQQHVVEQRLVATTRTYLSELEAVPELAHTFFLEIQLAGPEALLARRKVHQRFADFLRLLVAQSRRERPELRPLSPAMAVAIVGAINELMMVRLEQGRGDRLSSLAATITQLIESVVLPPRALPPQVGGTT
jgi:AcrR family transcriptional regulator